MDDGSAWLIDSIDSSQASDTPPVLEAPKMVSARVDMLFVCGRRYLVIEEKWEHPQQERNMSSTPL